MVETIQVRANGDANSQVTDAVKDKITSWFEDRGVDVADDFLYHHYEGGDYVAVSYKHTTVPDIDVLSAACGEALEYWRNKRVNERCIWVHREWIRDLE